MEIFALRELFQINFDSSLMSIALKHNSMFATDPEKGKVNQNLQCIGKNALNAASMLSAYSEDTNISATDLLKISNAKKNAFPFDFARKYDITPYIVSSNIKVESIIVDVLYQVIGVVFLSNDALKAYQFLLNILNQMQVQGIVDARTLVQEYAQKRKIPFSYTIIAEKGTDHEKVFTGQLSIGHECYIADGQSKKKAFEAAADKCVKSKNITADQHTGKHTSAPRKGKPFPIDAIRKNEIENIMCSLGIQDGLVAIQDIDSAFTHSSYANEQYKPDLARHNSTLKEIGSQLLLVAACCRLFKADDTNSLSVRVRELSAGSALSHAVDFKLFPYIRKAKSLDSIDVNAQRNALLECYEIVVAQLFIMCMEKNSAGLISSYNSFLDFLFSKAETYSFIDYTSQLQEMAQDLGCQVEYHEKSVNNLSDNSHQFVIEAAYISDGTVTRAIGKGKNTKAARNDAAKRLLKILLRIKETGKSQDNSSVVSADNNVSKETEYQTIVEKPELIKPILKPPILSAPTVEPAERTPRSKTPRPPSGIDSVSTVYRKQYTRSREIASYVKICAEGICELCGQPAPFNDLQGRPYLECHHVVWISEGGADSILNAVALCPTCHRKMHVLNYYEDREKLLRAAENHKRYFQF